ncbi:MAG: citrate/2-methylcitrate synthase, partial [Candidatus Thorarchaeota archaeon]
MPLEPISSIDPEKGKLYFRGLDVTELAMERSYEDVTHLLIYGQLPSEKESVDFRERMLKYRRLLEKELPLIFKTIGKNTKNGPQRMTDGIDRTEMLGLKPLARQITRISSKYQLDSLDSVVAFVAMCPAVLAAGWKHLKEQSIVSPNDTLSLSHNFVWMMKEMKLPLGDQKDLDACFILHMDDPNNLSLNAL